MYHIFFIHFSVNGHLGCCHVLDTVNSAAMNIEGMYLFGPFFSGCVPRSGIARSYGSSIFRTALKGTGLNVDPETHNASIILYMYVIMSFY